MKHWNYRVSNYCGRYAIHEVYYDKDGNPSGMSDIIAPKTFKEIDEQDPIADLRWQLMKMLEALDKPVLIEQDFK